MILRSKNYLEKFLVKNKIATFYKVFVELMKMLINDADILVIDTEAEEVKNNKIVAAM